MTAGVLAGLQVHESVPVALAAGVVEGVALAIDRVIVVPET